MSENDFLTTRNASMPFLSLEQRLELIELMSESRWTDDAMWNHGLALTALLLGGGLKIGEAIRLTVNCIHSDGWIALDQSIAMRPRRTRLMYEVSGCVNRWLIKLPSTQKHVFAARRLRAEDPHLEASSAFRGVKRICQAVPSLAREHSKRVSPQTLRNTYLSLMVDAGHGVDLIAEYMGFDSASSANRAVKAYLISRPAHGESPSL